MKKPADRTGYIAKGIGYILQAVVWMFMGFHCTSAPVIFWSGIIAILGVVECGIFILWADDLGQYLRRRRRKIGCAECGNDRGCRVKLIQNWSECGAGAKRDPPR